MPPKRDPNADEVENQLRSFMKDLGKNANEVRKKSIAEKMEACHVIGIDLGTATSCAAVWKNNEIKVITVLGKRTLPSVVGFVHNSKERERIIGEQAVRKSLGSTKFAKKQRPNTIYEVKRLIGKKFNDETIQKDIKNWPFKVIPDSETQNAIVEVNINGEAVQYTPEEISANILSTLKKAAEIFMDSPVEGAVITVPAYFNDQQRQATIHAGVIAGLEVKAIINEPTAAALAYAFLENKTKASGSSTVAHIGKQNLFIFDLGGGTFDVTILQHDHGIVEVLATAGDGHLGGVDFDHKIAEYFDVECKKKLGFSPLKKDVTKMMAAAKEAKHELSAGPTAHFTIEMEDEEFESEITRSKFEQICADILERCKSIMDNALKQSKLTIDEIDQVILIGGSTNIPYVREMVKEYFKGKKICADISADEAVAMGAAIQAAAIYLPAKQKKGTLLQDLKVVDVNPMNIGIKIKGDLMHVIVPANSHLPFESKYIQFKTSADNQDSTDIEIFEGLHENTTKNRLLGKFLFGGFPLRQAGKVKLQIKIKVDTNGVLDVMAKLADEESGTSVEHVTINKNKGVLSSKRVEEKRNEIQTIEKKQSQRQLVQNSADQLQKMSNFLKVSADQLNGSNFDELKKSAKKEAEEVERYLEEEKGNYKMEDLLSKITSIDGKMNKPTFSSSPTQIASSPFLGTGTQAQRKIEVFYKHESACEKLTSVVRQQLKEQSQNASTGLGFDKELLSSQSERTKPNWCDVFTAKPKFSSFTSSSLSVEHIQSFSPQQVHPQDFTSSPPRELILSSISPPISPPPSSKKSIEGNVVNKSFESDDHMDDNIIVDNDIDDEFERFFGRGSSPVKKKKSKASQEDDTPSILPLNFKKSRRQEQPLSFHNKRTRKSFVEKLRRTDDTFLDEIEEISDEEIGNNKLPKKQADFRMTPQKTPLTAQKISPLASQKSEVDKDVIHDNSHSTQMTPTRFTQLTPQQTPRKYGSRTRRQIFPTYTYNSTLEDIENDANNNEEKQDHLKNEMEEEESNQKSWVQRIRYTQSTPIKSSISSSSNPIPMKNMKRSLRSGMVAKLHDSLNRFRSEVTMQRHIQIQQHQFHNANDPSNSENGGHDDYLVVCIVKDLLDSFCYSTICKILVSPNHESKQNTFARIVFTHSDHANHSLGIGTTVKILQPWYDFIPGVIASTNHLELLSTPLPSHDDNSLEKLCNELDQHIDNTEKQAKIVLLNS